MPFIRLLSLPVGERGVVSIPPPHLRGGAIKHMALNYLTTLNTLNSTLQKLK